MFRGRRGLLDLPACFPAPVLLVKGRSATPNSRNGSKGRKDLGSGAAGPTPTPTPHPQVLPSPAPAPPQPQVHT